MEDYYSSHYLHMRKLRSRLGVTCPKPQRVDSIVLRPRSSNFLSISVSCALILGYLWTLVRLTPDPTLCVSPFIEYSSLSTSKFSSLCSSESAGSRTVSLWRSQSAPPSVSLTSSVIRMRYGSGTRMGCPATWYQRKTAFWLLRGGGGL